MDYVKYKENERLNQKVVEKKHFKIRKNRQTDYVKVKENGRPNQKAVEKKYYYNRKKSVKDKYIGIRER